MQLKNQSFSTLKDYFAQLKCAHCKTLVIGAPYYDRVVECPHKLRQVQHHWRCDRCHQNNPAVTIQFNCDQCNRIAQERAREQAERVANASQVMRLQKTGRYNQVQSGELELVSVSKMCLQSFPCQHNVTFRNRQGQVSYVQLFSTEIIPILQLLGREQELPCTNGDSDCSDSD